MTDRFPAPAEALERLHQGAGRLTGSDLATLAAEFVGWKRLLGHRYRSEERALRLFLDFQRTRGVIEARQLSRAAVLAYGATADRVHPRTWRNRVVALSVFLEHLAARGLVAENPARLLARPCPRRYRPYLFAPDELHALFVRLPERFPFARTRALIYAVLYAGALRVSEAIGLRRARFDAQAGLLTIVKTKFGKDRLVPLHPGVVAALRAYVERERREASADAPLFVNAAGRAFDRDRLIGRFHEDLARLGLARPSRDVDGVRHGGPRLHSFRHSFAVHRLLQWYREGADVQAKLPLLSTFLGHGNVADTQVYLTVTGALLRAAHGRFSRHCERALPLSP